MRWPRDGDGSVRDDVNHHKSENGSGEQCCRRQKYDRQAPAECGESGERVLTQDLICAPDTQERGAAYDGNDAGHAEEQQRRSKARHVSGGPLRNDPTRAGGLVLGRLKRAQGGCGEQHGGWQHQQPLANGKKGPAEGVGGMRVDVLHVYFVP